MSYWRKVLLIPLVIIGQHLISCTPVQESQVQTLVAEAGQTVIAEGGNFAKTQAAQFKETAEAGFSTEAANIKSTLIPRSFQATIAPPYDACVGKSISITSPPANSEEVIEKGFGIVSFSCDEKRGAINNIVLLFGGKNGSILDPPNYETDVSSGIEFDFIPPFTGNLRIDVTMSVNSKTGAASGSAIALPEFRDVILEFVLPAKIDAFLQIAESLIFQTASGVKTDAYIYIESNNIQDETMSTVGGHGFASSFPIPPNSQSANFSSETVAISLITPVTQGERIFIGTGIKTTALVHGWAVAYWNPSQKQEVVVTLVELTEVK
jgi:hypothetical protein